MAQERAVWRVPTRRVASASRALQWTVPFTLVVGPMGIGISLLGAIAAYLREANGSALIFLGCAGVITGCATAIGLRQHRRERYAFHSALAAIAIRENRFVDALHCVETLRGRWSADGAANWFAAYAALHDGRIDDALRLTSAALARGKNRALFRALRALTHAVTGNRRHLAKDVAAVRKLASADDAATAAADENKRLALALSELALVLSNQLPIEQVEMERVDDELLAPDAALLRFLRTQRREPYRIPTREEASPASDGDPAIQKWIAVAQGLRLPTNGGKTPPPSPLPALKQQKTSRRVLVGLAIGMVVAAFAVAWPGSEPSLSAMLWVVATLAFFVTPLFAKLPSLEFLATYSGHLRARIATKMAEEDQHVASQTMAIRSELLAVLAQAHDLEARHETGAALALADKTIYRIDSGAYDWAEDTLVPELIAVRARSLALLGNSAEADNEIGVLRKHAVENAALVEWQVDLRSAVVEQNRERVLALVKARQGEETTPADRDLIARVLGDVVE